MFLNDHELMLELYLDTVETENIYNPYLLYHHCNEFYDDVDFQDCVEAVCIALNANKNGITSGYYKYYRTIKGA